MFEDVCADGRQTTVGDADWAARVLLDLGATKPVRWKPERGRSRKLARAEVAELRAAVRIKRAARELLPEHRSVPEVPAG